MSQSSKKFEWVIGGIFLFVAYMILYSLFFIFNEKDRPATPVEIFSLEFTLASTSGMIAPLNAWFRSSDEGALEDIAYQNDIERYGDVYRQGLDRHPWALILGDVFGSIFSILSAIALMFAIRAENNWSGFKIMFFTEIGEETLYYMNVYRMTNEFDVGPIDVGVTLVIAIIVGFFGEQARKRRAKK